MLTEPISSLSKLLVNTFVKPKVEEWNNSIKSKKQAKRAADVDVVAEYFAYYLRVTFERCMVVENIIFQNQQVKLLDVYIPLRIIVSGSLRKSKSVFTLKKFPETLFKNYRRVLISDSIGTGKSTIVRFLALDIIKGNYGIPVLVELRVLNTNNSLLDEIFNQLSQLGKELDKDFVFKLIEKGDFIFLFDGYDEISKDYIEQASIDLDKFISKAPQCYFLITSRNYKTINFGHFQRFSICDISDKEVGTLFKKLKDITFSKKKGTFVEIDCKEIAQRNLFKNPFCLSLLFHCHFCISDNPNKTILFFDQLYFAMYKRHDESKGSIKRPIQSHLTMSEFRQVLSYLSYVIAIRNKRIYNELDLVGYILDIKKDTGLMHFREEDFFYDLLNTVPFFVLNDNNQSICWLFDDLKDYFVALYILNYSKEKKDVEYIDKEYFSRFPRTLSLLYELDPPFIRKTIFYPFLKKYILHIETSYQNCSEISAQCVQIMRDLTFRYDFYLYKTKHMSADEHNRIIEKIRRKDIYDSILPTYSKAEGVNIYHAVRRNRSSIEFLLTTQYNLVRKTEISFPQILNAENIIQNIDCPENELIQLTDNLQFLKNPSINLSAICSYLLNDLSTDITFDRYRYKMLDIEHCRLLYEEIRLEL